MQTVALRNNIVLGNLIFFDEFLYVLFVWDIVIAIIGDVADFRGNE